MDLAARAGQRLGQHRADRAVVVGDKEKAAGVVAVRARGNTDLGQMTLSDFLQRLADEIATRGVDRTA